MDELLELAKAGGATLASMIATDAWTTAKTGFARFFGRGDQRRRELTERRLDEAATELEQASSDDERDQARQQLTAVWRTRLQDLLEEHPQAAPELRILLRDLGAQLVTSQSTGAVMIDARAYDQAKMPVLGQGTQINTFGGDKPTS